MAATSAAPVVVLDVEGLDEMVATLAADGWTVLGPVVQDGAVVSGPVSGVADLPRGVGDDQQPGRYRLRERDDLAYFGWATAATSWKPVLFPSRHLLWRGTRTPDGFSTQRSDEPTPPLALLGVRSCDLAAMAVHDRVLAQRWGDRPAVDPDYVARRDQLFVVAVTCGEPASTCFCLSAGTGPAPHEGYDLALTEVLDDDGHRFVVQAGSPVGSALLARLPGRPATPQDEHGAQAVLAHARTTLAERGPATGGLPALLDAEVEHPLWDDVAERCLACGNCTAVCPTCFCTSVQDVTDLSGDRTERWRVWDSCFSAGFSYVHGGPVRASTKARYRQWLSHKLGTWSAQFDTSGCVGCGRCITWCPVGIDITREVAELQATARTAAVRRAPADRVVPA
jgi:ferredoxin